MVTHQLLVYPYDVNTRWFKYDRDYLCVNKPVTVPVIFEPLCILGGSIHTCTIKENAEALLIASNEIGLEVNANKI